MSELPVGPNVDIDDLRNFLHLSSSADVEGLTEVLAATVDRVQSMVTVSLDTDEVTYRPRPRPTGALLIPTGADELLTVTDPTGVDVDAADLDVDLDAGIIWPTSRTLHRGAWTVTVRYPGASAAVLLAVKIIAKHLWGVHRGSGGRAGPRGGVAAQDEPALAGFAIPRRARELLEPYLSEGGFA